MNFGTCMRYELKLKMCLFQSMGHEFGYMHEAWTQSVSVSVNGIWIWVHAWIMNSKCRPIYLFQSPGHEFGYTHEAWTFVFSKYEKINVVFQDYDFTNTNYFIICVNIHWKQNRFTENKMTISSQKIVRSFLDRVFVYKELGLCTLAIEIVLSVKCVAITLLAY